MRGRVSYAAIIRSEAIHRHPQKKEWIASTASVLAMTEKNSSAINSIARPANRIRVFRNRVKSQNKKYFAFPEMQIRLHRLHPVPLRGALAIVTTRGGSRWTRKLRLTSAADAYGKDVWS